MIKSVNAYAAASATAPLALHPITRRLPRPDDVEIDILYCGVCHSDLHTARNDWGWTRYPIVPGHEIIGRVVAIGSQVSRFKVGDRVEAQRFQLVEEAFASKMLAKQAELQGGSFPLGPDRKIR